MIKIRNDQLQNARAGLSGLEGFERVIKDGERERTIMERFKYNSGTLLLQVKLMNRLDDLLRIRSSVQNAALRQASGGTGIINPQNQPTEFAAYAKIIEEMEAKECEIDLSPLTESDLDLNKNAISAGVLAALGPLFAIGE